MLESLAQFILTILFMSVIGCYILRKVQEYRRYIRHLEKIPGPTPGWIFGNVFDFDVPREYLSDVLDKHFKTYGSIVRVWYLTYMRADIFVSKPEFLEIIMTKHLKKSTSYDTFRAWLGNGLVTSEGIKWQLHRKLITPAFHFKILEDFFQVFVERAEILVAQLRKLSGEPVVNLMPVISRCALDIICETAMGAHWNIQEDKEHDNYVQNIYDINELVIYRMYRPWLYPDFIFYLTGAGKRYLQCLKVIHGFTDKVIQERKLQRQTKPLDLQKDTDDKLLGYKKKLALLDLLLESCDTNQPLTDLEIREEVTTFMFGGHDTTSLATTWTLYLLGRHPDIQKEVVEELDSIFAGTSRRCSYKDLPEMKYLERVIKESLRLYPSVPMVARKVEEEVNLGEYTIPAHMNVTLDFYHMHRDPQLYENPETFNPDNFLPENIKKRHPFAYIPFSAGPRNCIGQKYAMMELKTLLSSILRNFRVEATEEAPLKYLELTLKPVNGLLVKLTPRNCC